jgi:FkbM family methyltransferase
MKGLAVRFFDMCGLALIPKWRLDHREIAEHLKELFAKYKIDCVLDIGANEGQYGTFLRTEVGYRGDIVSFEPVSHVAEALKQRAAADRSWRVFNYALGRSEGTASINVTRGSQMSSLLQPTTLPTGWSHPASEILKTENVPVHPLDAIIGDVVEGWPKRNVYMKVDVQGFELEVAQGAKASLPAMVGMQAEISLLALYEGMPDMQTAVDYFRAQGFDVTGMFVVGRDAQLRAIDFDCVLLNSKLL